MWFVSFGSHWPINLLQWLWPKTRGTRELSTAIINSVYFSRQGWTNVPLISPHSLYVEWTEEQKASARNKRKKCHFFEISRTNYLENVTGKVSERTEVTSRERKRASFILGGLSHGFLKIGELQAGPPSGLSGHGWKKDVVFDKQRAAI